jgi:hypothetical protein
VFHWPTVIDLVAGGNAALIGAALLTVYAKVFERALVAEYRLQIRDEEAKP